MRASAVVKRQSAQITAWLRFSVQAVVMRANCSRSNAALAAGGMHHCFFNHGAHGCVRERGGMLEFDHLIGQQAQRPRRPPPVVNIPAAHVIDETETDRDRKHFLELIEAAVSRFGIVVHAFVLLDNHYHLVVETPTANLSAAMQWMNVSYSVWLNRRRGRAGHLFQGRFKAVVAEPEAYAVELRRYVGRKLWGAKLRELAELAGVTTEATVTLAVKRLDDRMRREIELREKVKAVQFELLNVKT